MVTITRPLQVVLVAAWAFYAQAASVVLVDANSNSVLRHVQDIRLNARSLAVADAILLRLQPPYSLDEPSSVKISQLFSRGYGAASHKMLEHPTAFLFLNLNGLEQGDLNMLVSSVEAGQYSLFDVGSDASSDGQAVLLELQTLALQNGDVPFHRLDRFQPQECDDACLAGSLREVASIVGGEYDKAASLDGTLKLGTADLDLNQPEIRLFAIELALFHRSAATVLSSARGAQDVLVLDMVFSNLAALAEQGGGPAAAAAVQAIVRMVNWIKTQHESTARGHFAYQIALLGKGSTAELEEAMQPKVVSRRLQAQANAADPAKQAMEFSNRATCYGAAFLLIYFTFAGIYCLTSMEFKADSLLYSKGKVD